jgi:hypothetical protein
MRFPFGRVGAIVPSEDRRLVEFEAADGVLFRVRVTSAAGRHGVMLAEADRISARRPEEVEEYRTSLLPVRSCDLDQEVWRVDFNDGPVLLINKSLDKHAVANSHFFQSLVYPQAMREILTRILLLEDFPNREDHDDWRTQWLNFAESLPGVGETQEEDTDRFEDWIDSAVASFARRHGLLGLFATFWQREENR